VLPVEESFASISSFGTMRPVDPWRACACHAFLSAQLPLPAQPLELDADRPATVLELEVLRNIIDRDIASSKIPNVLESRRTLTSRSSSSPRPAASGTGRTIAPSGLPPARACRCEEVQGHVVAGRNLDSTTASAHRNLVDDADLDVRFLKDHPCPMTSIPRRPARPHQLRELARREVREVGAVELGEGETTTPRAGMLMRATASRCEHDLDETRWNSSSDQSPCDTEGVLRDARKARRRSARRPFCERALPRHVREARRRSAATRSIASFSAAVVRSISWYEHLWRASRQPRREKMK